MPRSYLLPCLGCALTFLACSSGEAPSSDDVLSPFGASDGRQTQSSEEQPIVLDRLPPAVVAAALDAVRGLVLAGAEIDLEDGEAHYDVWGFAQGVRYEVEVSPEGRVTEIEKGDDKDDDDHENEGEEARGADVADGNA